MRSEAKKTRDAAKSAICALRRARPYTERNNKMKRTISLISALLLLFALAGCASKPAAESAGDSMTLEEIADSILTDVKDLPAVQNIELNDENFAYYAFVEPAAGVTGLASEAMIGSIAHSVVLLRAADQKAAEALAKDVEMNMNPRKWICVEAEKSIVSVHGSTVLLVMSFESTADAIAANFDALWA